MANKWIIAAATAALFCCTDWLAVTHTPPATPIAPVAPPVERPLAAAYAGGRIEAAATYAATAQAG